MTKNQFLRIVGVTCMSSLVTISATASPVVTDDPNVEEHEHSLSLGGHLVRPSPDAALLEHDAAVSGIVSDAPFAHVTKNLAPASHGARLEADATTDVWVLGNYAYTGTFNDPCGGEANAGIFVWDVHNRNKVSQAGFVPSPVGSRANDVKAASLNSGDIESHTTNCSEFDESQLLDY